MSGLSVTDYFPFKRMKITDQKMHSDQGVSALIRLAPDLRYRPVCHDCGSPAMTVHSKGHRRHVRGPEPGRRSGLAGCGIPQDLVLHLRRCSGGTVRFCRCLQPGHPPSGMTVQDVAEHLELNPKTVKAIGKAFLEKSFGQTDGRGLRVLAIDEIAVRKGHNYMTVVMDYFTGRVVWMGENRSKETLDAFFAALTDTQKQGIEAVAIDMWEPFIRLS